MKIEIELPETLVSELQIKSRSQHMTRDEYASELLYQSLALASVGNDVTIENRPDWQQALERSRADLRAGRVVSHNQVENLHRSHPD
jgi:hypothetical protein